MLAPTPSTSSGVALSDFTNMSAQERADIANYKRDSTITVPKIVDDVNVAAIHFPKFIEHPPTTLIYDDKLAAELFVGLGGGLKASWQRLIIMTYRAGGKVFYREHGPDSLEAVFVFVP